MIRLLLSVAPEDVAVTTTLLAGMEAHSDVDSVPIDPLDSDFPSSLLSMLPYLAASGQSWIVTFPCVDALKLALQFMETMGMTRDEACMFASDEATESWTFERFHKRVFVEKVYKDESAEKENPAPQAP